MVGDDEDRRTEVVAETVDQLEHVVSVLVAELAGRLVGEQELRCTGDAARQGQALALAARHRRDDLVALGLEAHPAQQLGVAEGAVGVAAGRAAEAEVLPGRGVGEEVAGRTLEHRAHPRRPDLGELTLAHPRDLLVADEDPAGARPLDAAEEGQQGRLARAAGAEEGDALAGVDAEVDTLERDDVVALERLVEVDQALAADRQAARALGGCFHCSPSTRPDHPRSGPDRARATAVKRSGRGAASTGHDS
jgi:hypothetical protein